MVRARDTIRIRLRVGVRMRIRIRIRVRVKVTYFRLLKILVALGSRTTKSIPTLTLTLR